MKNFKSEIKISIISISSVLLLSSCSFLEAIGGMMCELAPESDHCFQFIAVQSSSPSACENIKGSNFKDTGSNPPKDKCYLQIAINTGDESICNNIKGGMMSYTKEECQGETRTKVVKTVDEQLNDINKKIEYSVGSETEQLLKQKSELEAKLKASFDKLPDTEKQAYYTKKKDEILQFVYDEDLKQAIAHNYNSFRGKHQDDILAQLDGLKRITETEKTAKELDENANKLVDTVKSTLIDMANEEKDAILDEAKEKLLEEAYNRSGTNMKYMLDKMKGLKETYDKGSEMYNEVNEKYEKLKAAYEKMKDIQDRLNKIELLGKQGKLDAGKVEVLKGSILLGEGLEYATSYVPVFGSTMSTITKETFGVVNKFATNRAVRTTAINKCIDDPEHCDTEGISGY
ncbi:MAG: hypothetical protein PHS49_04430 [Candidatus Gracilibacteria bacterium]|nr:hypothetical protein [Candidatus Gracilibacteria bacterium]